MARRQTLRPGYLNGQTYAEFMMVVLPTLMFIFGIISFAMTVYTYSFLSMRRATRSGMPSSTARRAHHRPAPMIFRRMCATRLRQSTRRELRVD
jgi:hypothetical protein